MRRERGASFVITLAILAGLIAILASTVANQRQGFQDVLARVEGDRARSMAFAGVQRAVAAIAASQSGSTAASSSSASSASDNSTNLNQEWATVGDNGNEKLIVGQGSFRLQIVDASSLLNINTVKEDQLEKLPLTQEQIESWLDYREAGATARANGAKDDYYSNLTKPYNAALKRMETVDQLLQVKGFTPALLYQAATNQSSNGTTITGQDGGDLILADILTASSYSPNTNSEGQAKTNINAQGTSLQALVQAPLSLPQNLAQQIASRKDWGGIGELLALPGATQADVAQRILDNLTISAGTRIEGKINLNTVTEPVLNAIPQLTSDMVQSILQRQTQGFATLGELASVPGFSGTPLQDTADLFTVSSQSFLVRVIGTAGDQSRAIEAFVEVREGVPVIVQIFEPPFNDMRSRWFWQEEATSETTIAEGA
ncbi:hypothetical protein EON79_12375 [bacterium]|nr:MAG: hypothetical protein EON79_12375 [bacterium]